MTLPASKIGDKGQRYQAEERGWQHESEWRVIGWSHTAMGAEKMCTAIRCHPSCIETRVIDRQAPLPGSPKMSS
jgi:hypothetical protein